MPSDAKTYLAEAEERASAYQTYLSQDDLRDPEVYERLIEASQADVGPLLEILQECRDYLTSIVDYIASHPAMPSGAEHGQRIEAIARKAREKQPSASTKE